MKMNLWVRSQKKDYLININNLIIEEYNGYHGIETKIGESIFELGEYKTKERAIEVLDEIQNFMRNSVYVKKTNRLGEEIDLIPKPILIYNMPKK